MSEPLLPKAMQSLIETLQDSFDEAEFVGALKDGTLVITKFNQYAYGNAVEVTGNGYMVLKYGRVLQAWAALSPVHFKKAVSKDGDK